MLVGRLPRAPLAVLDLQLRAGLVGTDVERARQTVEELLADAHDRSHR